MTITDVLKNDARLIRRDMFLLMMCLFVVYIGLVLRFGLPWVDRILADGGLLPSARNGHGFAWYYPTIISLLNVYTGPILAGSVFGLLVLTEKDEQTMRALLASPMSPGQYAAYRILFSYFSALVIVVFLFYVVAQSVPGPIHLALISLAAAMAGPMVMLTLAIVSDSRVQGMSYSKFVSFGGYLTLISWWVPEPYQWFFGLFPPYWVSKAYWSILQGSAVWGLYLSLGVLLQGLCIWLLWKLFVRKVYDSV